MFVEDYGKVIVIDGQYVATTFRELINLIVMKVKSKYFNGNVSFSFKLLNSGVQVGSTSTIYLINGQDFTIFSVNVNISNKIRPSKIKRRLLESMIQALQKTVYESPGYIRWNDTIEFMKEVPVE